MHMVRHKERSTWKAVGEVKCAFGAIGPSQIVKYSRVSKGYLVIGRPFSSLVSPTSVDLDNTPQSSFCSEGNAKVYTMMGGFLTRLSVMILGYAYPAYQCYKTVELNKPEIEQLLFWCQYWILVAVLSVFERVGDVLISWLPLYGEVKLAFFVYLWHPKTKGTTYIYNTFFQPFMSRHENMIDRKLLELRTRATDLAARYWQKALRLGRSRFLEILQYVISQPSSTMAHPVEESKKAQPSSTAPPNEAEQPSTSQQPKTEQTNLVTTHKPDQAEADDNSPIPPSPASHKPGHGGHSSRSSTPSHPPNSSPPHNAILPQEKLSTTNNHHSSPHSKDTRQEEEEEEPTRVVRRSRIKKRVSTTATSIH